MSDALNELYQEVVLEHKRAPRNFGHLPHPTHQAQGTNPSCGDQIAVELDLRASAWPTSASPATPAPSAWPPLR
jgi:NifU-like protein involved in Fe-S cluster formation